MCVCCECAHTQEHPSIIFVYVFSQLFICHSLIQIVWSHIALPRPLLIAQQHGIAYNLYPSLNCAERHVLMFQVTQCARTHASTHLESKKKKLYRFNLYVYCTYSLVRAISYRVCAHSVRLHCLYLLLTSFENTNLSLSKQIRLRVHRQDTYTFIHRARGRGRETLHIPYDKCLRIINGIHQPSLKWNSFGINIYRQLKQWQDNKWKQCMLVCVCARAPIEI